MITEGEGMPAMKIDYQLTTTMNTYNKLVVWNKVKKH